MELARISQSSTVLGLALAELAGVLGLCFFESLGLGTYFVEHQIEQHDSRELDFWSNHKHFCTDSPAPIRRVRLWTKRHRSPVNGLLALKKMSRKCLGHAYGLMVASISHTTVRLLRGRSVFAF